MRRFEESRAAKLSIAVAGLVFGFYFSSNIVMSDGTAGPAEPSQATKKAPQDASTSVHLLRTADTLAVLDESALPSTISDLDPATISMLRALKPAAQGRTDAAKQSAQTALNPLPEQTLYSLHLASIASEADVSDIIEQLKRQGGQSLSKLDFTSVSTDQNGQNTIFTRILAGTYGNQDAAQASCDRVKISGQYCAVLQVNP